MSSALDTPSWVTLTHMHADYKIRVWLVSHLQCVCVSDRQCVSLSLGRLSTGPHLSERERRGLVSAEAESILSLLCLCFCLPSSPSNPSEAGF